MHFFMCLVFSVLIVLYNKLELHFFSATRTYLKNAILSFSHPVCITKFCALDKTQKSLYEHISWNGTFSRYRVAYLDLHKPKLETYH